MFINLVSELGTKDCSKEEANSKTQVGKASDTRCKSIGFFEESYSEGIRRCEDVRSDSRKPDSPAKVANIR